MVKKYMCRSSPCVKLVVTAVSSSVRGEWGVAGWSMSYQRISHKRLSLLWKALWLYCCWTSGAAATAHGQGDSADSLGSLSWLLSDKGPFHQSLEFTEAAERYQQGYTTRYKIYRWVAHVFQHLILTRLTTQQNYYLKKKHHQSVTVFEYCFYVHTLSLFPTSITGNYYPY